MKKIEIDDIALSAGNIENLITALELLTEHCFYQTKDIRREDLCALDGIATALSILSKKHGQLIEEYQPEGDN